MATTYPPTYLSMKGIVNIQPAHNSHLPNYFGTLYLPIYAFKRLGGNGHPLTYLGADGHSPCYLRRYGHPPTYLGGDGRPPCYLGKYGHPPPYLGKDGHIQPII